MRTPAEAWPDGNGLKRHYPRWPERNTSNLAIHDDPESAASYLSATSGNFGQFYVASMLESGLLAPSRGVPLISDDHGRKMAAAFAASSGDAADLFVQAVIDGRARVADLKPFGETMGPGTIPDGSEEMKLLRDFLGGEVGGHRAAARRSSAWLLLDYMRSGNTYSMKTCSARQSIAGPCRDAGCRAAPLER